VTQDEDLEYNSVNYIGDDPGINSKIVKIVQGLIAGHKTESNRADKTLPILLKCHRSKTTEDRSSMQP